jgi:tetratricopeptide (TPR) repeat protein
VTRFHRAAFTDLVPWALPPAKDLAHGFDVKCIAERTVALVPCGVKDDAEAVVVNLVFADDGRLAERRVVQLPKRTVLRRETYGADGMLRLLDGENKVLSERKLALKAGAAADLEPDLKGLVMLSMPLRTRDYLVQQPGAVGGNLAMMDNAACLALMAADAAVGNAGSVDGAVRSRAWNLGDTYAGFTALLLSAGQDINALPAPPINNHSPIARYVTWLKQSQSSAGSKKPAGLLDRLIEVQSLQRRWQQAAPLTGADCDRMLKFVREAESPVFVWAAVEEVLRTPDKRVTAPGGRAKVQRDVLRAAIDALKGDATLSYAVRYEYARYLAENGERDEARKAFVAIYEDSAKVGLLPPVDASFHKTLTAQGPEPDLFERTMRATAERLVKDGRRRAAVALAWQCWELEAPTVADMVVATALSGMPNDEHRLAPTFAAVVFLSQTRQYDRADRLLDGLLADSKLAHHAELWRTGYQLALQRKQPTLAFARLAEALEQEYRARPEWIDLEAVRRDYGSLLNHFAEVVRATATLGQKPPADLAAKVVRAADRWRSLDVDGALASGPAYQSLRGLPEPDLAWDYLLMSAGADRDGFSWANLAQSLRQTDDFDLAERAYAQAVLADPANADLARARAENLLQAGRESEARGILRRAGVTTTP